MLKERLEKQGICAKVTRIGFAIETPKSVDLKRAKLPPIGSKPVGNKFHLQCSTSDVFETEIKRMLLCYSQCFFFHF